MLSFHKCNGSFTPNNYRYLAHALNEKRKKKKEKKRKEKLRKEKK